MSEQARQKVVLTVMSSMEAGDPQESRNEAAASGTRPGLEELFENEEGHLVRFACGITGRRAVAEEVVQEAFLRLHRDWAGIENPRAWLYRATRNLCLTWIRDHRREVDGGTDEGKAGGIGAADPSLPAPDEVLGRMEAAGMVRFFLAEMPAQDRELIHLKYHEDLKYAEIAERTGLSVGNVGYRLHHALRGLATSLRQVGVSGSNG